jgi:hypothetical protein
MGALLQKDARSVNLPGAEDDILLETCDVEVGRTDVFSEGGSRSYKTLVPWDIPMRLALTSCIIVIFTLALILVPDLYEFHQIPSMLLIVAVFIGLLFGIVSVLSQIPRRIVRQADTLVIEFLLHSHTVPLGDVLEMVVLRDGRQFWQLLKRWKVLPYGQKFRLFFGAPSRTGALCVVLTRRCFWSFVFCLQDPVQFLLDNQRPLSSEATYKAALKCVLREDEDLHSLRLGNVARGANLKVLEQRGRRVRVKLEGSDSEGWISIYTSKGIALLTRQNYNKETIAGTIGASELTRSADTRLEMGLIGGKGGDE